MRKCLAVRHERFEINNIKDLIRVQLLWLVRMASVPLFARRTTIYTVTAFRLGQLRTTGVN